MSYALRVAVGLNSVVCLPPCQKRGTGRFRLQVGFGLKLKLLKLYKRIDGVVVVDDDVWIWRRCEDRLMTIELEGDGMMG